jgi:hypothetical protein
VIGRDQIVIGLSPTCLRVASFKGGRLVGVTCTPLEAGEWEQSWTHGLTPLDEKLAEALKTARVGRKARARVVYFSQTATAEVFSVPVRGSAALQAANFSLVEALPDRGSGWPISLTPLYADARTVPSPKTHVLGVADSPHATETLAAWVMRAGLTLESLIPAKAAVLSRAVAAAQELPASGTHSLLWIEDHVTVFVGWSAGSLIFARSLDFGYWKLAEAIARGGRVGDCRGVDNSLAYQTLFAAGIPQRNQGSEPGPTGVSLDGVLPLMQPVLQRYLVETRQTLRFTIPEAEQPKVRVLLAGPVAEIPNLAAALESNFDTGIEVYKPESSCPVSPVDAGELGCVTGLPFSGLLPPSEADRRMNRRLNGVLRLSGTVLAMVMLAAGGWAYARNVALQREISSLQPRIDAMEEHEYHVRRAQKLSTDIEGATQAIRDTLGERPRWFAALALISRDCGEFIEINHITGAYGPDKSPALTLSGTAYHGRNNIDSLTDFVTRISRNPVIANVRIVSSHTTEVSGVEAKSFIINVHLRSIDADAGLHAMLDAHNNAFAGAEEPQP